MWVRHRPEYHKQDFQNGSKTDSQGSKPSSASINPEIQETPQPAVKVDTKMFQALKSGSDIQAFLNRLAEHNTVDLN
jgi:hypothetical protein